MRANANVTIFNRYIEDRETKYKKSYIYGVHWEDRKGVNVLQSGLNTADASTVYIPFTSVKNYVNPARYRIIKQGVTIQPEDIIIKGIIDDELSETITLKTLESKYDNVRVVTSVDTMDFGHSSLHHWEVGAK